MIYQKRIKRYMCNVDKKNENGISNTWQTRQKDKSTRLHRKLDTRQGKQTPPKTNGVEGIGWSQRSSCCLILFLLLFVLALNLFNCVTILSEMKAIV